MGDVAHLNPQFDPRQLDLIRRTVAADTTADEFDIFISYCRALGLDPLRKQIYALVYNKKDPAKRRMSIIVGIDGFRSVAARSGNYRPDNDEPAYEYDPLLKSDLNPLGLIKATVKIWQFSHGEWFPVAASAYWDEYAAIKEEWGVGEDGRRGPTGRKTVDGKWASMPRLMLAKTAEALALRKAFPDNFSNVYSPEEMDRASVELLPSEAAEEGAAEKRREKLQLGKSITIDWLDPLQPLDAVPVGKFADRAFAFIEANRSDPAKIAAWTDKNRQGLKEFWSLNPNDALEIKKAIEACG